MHFLNPTYLWAFLGLLVPIAIHLWNKKESKTIQIGSVQLLSESNVKKSKRIQFNELLLLLLRLILLGVLVLILAAPQIRKQQANSSITYIIEPSLRHNKSVKTIIDSLASNDKARWLKKGFPEIKDLTEKDRVSTPKYWQLVKAMDNLPTDSIVVFTKALLSGVEGIRPKINKNIEWIVPPLENEFKKLVKATQKEKELELISMSSSNQFTTLKKEYVAANSSGIEWNGTKDSLVFDTKSNREIVALYKDKPIQVQLFYNNDLLSEKNYIEATFNALSKYLKHEIKVTVTKDKADLKVAGFDLTIWLSEENVSKDFNRLLIYKPNSTANSLIEKGSTNSIFYLTNTLNTENTITQHLAEELLKLLDRYKETNEGINHLDQRKLALQELLPRRSNETSSVQKGSLFNLSQWLWPLLMFLLIVERLIAKWRRQ